MNGNELHRRSDSGRGAAFIGQSLDLEILNGNVCRGENKVHNWVKKKKKCVRQKKSSLRMMVGDELRLEQVLEYSKKALTGKFYSQQVSEKSLNH